MSPPVEQSQNADESSAFFANNDASSYNTRYLKSIRNKDRFQELHFYQCSVELIDALFPKQAQKGTLNPPSQYRASAVALGQWRDLEQEEQLAALENAKQSQEGGADGENGGGDLKRDPSENIGSAAPAAKVLKTEEQSQVKIDIPEKWDPLSDELDVNFCKDRKCCGITLDFLKTTDAAEDAKLRGFGVLVGDGMQFKAQAYRSGQSWPFASDPRVVGAIVDQLPDESGKSFVVLKWLCVHSEEAPTNGSKLHAVQLHHFSCDRASQTTPCQNCRAHFLDVVNSCGDRVV